MTSSLLVPLHYQHLQMLRTKGLLKQQNYEACVQLDQTCRNELRWWLHHFELWNGKITLQTANFAVWSFTKDKSNYMSTSSWTIPQQLRSCTSWGDSIKTISARDTIPILVCAVEADHSYWRAFARGAKCGRGLQVPGLSRLEQTPGENSNRNCSRY